MFGKDFTWQIHKSFAKLSQAIFHICSVKKSLKIKSRNSQPSTPTQPSYNTPVGENLEKMTANMKWIMSLLNERIY